MASPYDTWSTHDAAVAKSKGATKFRYYRFTYENGKLLNTRVETVHTMNRTDFETLLHHWQRLGSNPSAIGGFHYQYSAI